MTCCQNWSPKQYSLTYVFVLRYLVKAFMYVRFLHILSWKLLTNNNFPRKWFFARFARFRNMFYLRKYDYATRSTLLVFKRFRKKMLTQCKLSVLHRNKHSKIHFAAIHNSNKQTWRMVNSLPFQQLTAIEVPKVTFKKTSYFDKT